MLRRLTEWQMLVGYGVLLFSDAAVTSWFGLDGVWISAPVWTAIELVLGSLLIGLAYLRLQQNQQVLEDLSHAE